MEMFECSRGEKPRVFCCFGCINNPHQTRLEVCQHLQHDFDCSTKWPTTSYAPFQIREANNSNAQSSKRGLIHDNLVQLLIRRR